MRLVADKMFIKLSRWLRLFGIAVEDANQESDDKLILHVKRIGAVLITADKQLAQRSKKKRFKVLLVEERDLDHQLAFVIKSLGLKIKEMPSMICPICGSKLVRISKERAKGKVPVNAFISNNRFYLCKKCNKIYWRGTHWKSIEKRRNNVIRIINFI